MKHPRLALALSVVLLGCVAVDLNVLRQHDPSVVNAEERGVSVALQYQRGYSNWGPTNVYGTAVLWPREGVATLSVHLLPRLEGGERYVWWVLNSTSGRALRLGTFNTTNAGESFLDTFIANGLPKGADAVVVSIAGKQDPLAAPGVSRTLYGRVPPLPAAGSGTSGAITGSGVSADSSGRSGTSVPGLQEAPYKLPKILPMTGGAQLLHRHHQ